MHIRTRGCFVTRALLLLVLGACGPLLVPMAGRLGDEDQRRVDQGWERALAPVDRLSHGEWLDVFVGASVFEEGVDKLSFRSEKTFSGGMEVVDRRGTILRREAFSRDDVIRAAGALFRREANEDAATREARDTRWAKIREYFPAKATADASPG